MRETRNQRGIAIITVILVLLLLTVLGLAASMMMTQEDTTSGRMDLQRGALYVAEAGLRHGEHVLSLVGFTNTAVNSMLRYTAVGATAAVYPNIPQVPSSKSDYSLAKLGTYLTTFPGGGVELSNMALQGMAPNASVRLPGRQAFYSLYIRNNPEDTGPITNSDTKVRLISVGWLAVNGRPLAVKILEEEYNWSGVTQSPSAQKQTNQGGTGQGIYGG